MEPRSSLFEFDIRYKTRESYKTLSATRQRTATREGGGSSMEQLREKEERVERNRGVDYLILISATRQGKLQHIVSNRTRSSYERRRSELHGIEKKNYLI